MNKKASVFVTHYMYILIWKNMTEWIYQVGKNHLIKKESKEPNEKVKQNKITTQNILW